ncbi:MAG: extracellular solute-binding protein [Actinomycetia bacterium]|nr:extracellular solute-binding protein [Actinomycetes bacterium]
MQGKRMLDKGRVALLICAAALALAVVAAGCGGEEEAAPPPAEPAPPPPPPPPGPPPPPEPAMTAWSLEEAAAPYAGTTVTILYEGNGDTSSSPGIAEAIKTFEQRTGIIADVQVLGHFEVIQKGEASMLSRTGEFDIVMLHNWQAPSLLQAGVIDDLKPYLDNPDLRDPSWDFDQTLQPETNKVSVLESGEVIALAPLYNYISIFWLRKDWIEHPDERAAFEAEYGYPLAEPTDWGQIVDIADFFTREAGETLAGETLNDPVYGLVLEGSPGASFLDIFGLAETFCGGFYDENGNPTANRPENVAALEFWASLWQYGPPNTAEITLFDEITIPTLEPSIAAMGDSSTDWLMPLDTPEANPNLAGKFTYFSWPPHPDTPECHAQAGGGPAYNVINAASDAKEASFLLLQWMSTEEFNNLWTANSPTVTLPVHIDAIDQGREDFSVYDQWVDGYDANVTGRETIAIIPRGTGILEITDLVQREAQAVGLGQKTAQEALDDVQAFMEDLCTTDCTITAIGDQPGG